MRWAILNHIADFHVQDGGHDAAVALLVHNLQDETYDSFRSGAFKHVAEIESDRGDREASSIAWEKAVQYAPGDTSLLFTAGYEVIGVDGFNDLAINNYDALLALTPNDAIAINNLAILAGDIPGKRIGLYKHSMNLSQTLPMANLANMYIDNGFFDEADEILQKALEREDVHENVNSAIVRLKEAREKQKNEWDERLARTRIRSERVRAYGDFLFRPDDTSVFEGSWIDPSGMQVDTIIDGIKLNANGERRANVGLLTTAMMGRSATGRTVKLTITGNVPGQV